MGRFHVDRVNVARLNVPPAVFGEHSDPAHELSGHVTRVDMLQFAVEKERHTIDYYTALKEPALGQENLKVINEIVEEEKRHVRILSQALGQSV